MKQAAEMVENDRERFIRWGSGRCQEGLLEDVAVEQRPKGREGAAKKIPRKDMQRLRGRSMVGVLKGQQGGLGRGRGCLGAEGERRKGGRWDQRGMKKPDRYAPFRPNKR